MTIYIRKFYFFIANVIEEDRYKLLKSIYFVVLKSTNVSRILSHPSGTVLSKNMTFLGLIETRVLWYYPFIKNKGVRVWFGVVQTNIPFTTRYKKIQ